MGREVIEFLKTTAGWTFAGACLIAAGAVSVFMYDLGKDVGESAAQSYRIANELRLPEITKEAKEATVALRAASEEYVSRANLTRENKQLSEQLAQREKEALESNERLSQVSNHLQVVQNELNQITKSQHVIRVVRDKATLAGAGKLSVSISEVYTSYAEVNFNGVKRKVSVGDRFEVLGESDVKCRVRIDEYKWMSPPFVTMAVEC
jgi:hypothetical protein